MSLSIHLVCVDEYPLAVRDLSAFLWDIALLHDRLITFWQSPNAPLLYSPNFYRRWRRLPSGLDLKVGTISRYSPIEIELIVATFGGLIIATKTFVELLHLIRDWPLEREKKRLENLQTMIEILERLERLREASPELLTLLAKDIHRVLGHPIRILEVKEGEFREWRDFGNEGDRI